MQGTNRLKKVLLGGLLLALGGCNGGILDDGDSADVVLLVQTLTVPPVTTQADPLGGCVFVVTNATGSLQNKAKNATAKSPFQDIVLQDVMIQYQWDDGFVTLPRTINLAGTVPVGGTGSVSFPPILLGDLDASRESHSAVLTLTFHGRTVEGNVVTSPPFSSSSATQGTVLGVNACITP